MNSMDTFHRTLIIGILLLGAAVIYICFGTSWLFDSRSLRSLPPEDRARAFPFWLVCIATVGVACITFSIDALFLPPDLGIHLPQILLLLLLVVAGNVVRRTYR